MTQADRDYLPSDMGMGPRLVIPEAGWLEIIQWLLGRRRRFVVRENSMVPTLRPGDTILAAMGRGIEIEVGGVAIATLPTPPNSPNTGSPELLIIKRISKTFHDGGVYLISDNKKDPTVRDSRHFGVVAADHIIGCVTSRLASAP